MKQNLLNLILIFVAFVSCTKQTTYVEVPPIVEHQQFSISENCPEGTLVGAITVENSQDRSLAFYLVKTENSEAFSIDEKTGLIQVNDSSLTDYESIQHIELEIMIAYQTGSNDYAIFPTVTIDIIDEIEYFEITINSSSGNSFDGMVSSLSSEQNFMSNEFLFISAWTNDLVPDINRSFIHFDLSVLPANINIISSILYLINPNDGISEHEHSQLTGSNEFIIAPIISDWNSETLNWNNQPSISFENQVEVEATLTENQHLEIDVTALINEEYRTQSDNYGMSLYLKNEAYYRRLCFASMNNKHVEIRPKLTISYLK